ncbi:hypothetical protein, partial [Salmonella enterica]|uniref:hypothetical protein n=1 Tax=Salmonella enterica TaxID=28901 RepID=UPI00398C706B
LLSLESKTISVLCSRTGDAKCFLLPLAFETQLNLACDDSRLSAGAAATSLAAVQYGTESGASGH